jgi:hypothetical protein
MKYLNYSLVSMARQPKSGISLLILKFSNFFYFKHAVGLLWTTDEPVAKASTDTGQHNVETQRRTSMSWSGFEPTIPVTKRPIRTLRPLCHWDRHIWTITANKWRFKSVSYWIQAKSVHVSSWWPQLSHLRNDYQCRFINASAPSTISMKTENKIQV